MNCRSTIAATLVMVPLAVSAACDSGSGDDTDTADAACACDAPNNPDAAPAPDADRDAGAAPAVQPLFDLSGFVRLTERSPGPSQFGDKSVRFMDGPPAQGFDLIAEEGACAYYRPIAPGFCDPACGFGAVCSGDSVCIPAPMRLSAGVVTISGLAETVTATPDQADWYTVTGLDGASNLFDPGDTISVSAAGGDIAAFTTSVSGVGDMLTSWTDHQLIDGDDNVFSWTVQGDGAPMELILQIGWHGNPPTDIIWCTGDDADGAITVPQAFVEMFPRFGGSGLFQNPSMIRRVNREIIDSSAGYIEVAVLSERIFGVTH